MLSCLGMATVLTVFTVSAVAQEACAIDEAAVALVYVHLEGLVADCVEPVGSGPATRLQIEGNVSIAEGRLTLEFPARELAGGDDASCLSDRLAGTLATITVGAAAAPVEFVPIRVEIGASGLSVTAGRL